MLRNVIPILLFLFVCSHSGFAQMERERATTDQKVETFLAPNLIGLSTVQNLQKGVLNVTIMHNFGLINDEPFKNFFGLDQGVNVRLGLDYGLTDNWSVGLARTTDGKLYHFRTKYSILQQTQSGSVPLSLSFNGNVGVSTVENFRPFEDDLSYLAAVLLARKINKTFSLQVSPMISHFNSAPIGNEKTLFSLAFGTEIHLGRRYSLIAEYLPVIGEQPGNLSNAFGVGLNIETGGHVFQLFLKTSNWHTEQYMLANNTEKFFDGDIRFGFNVNRLFWLGGKDR